MWVEPREKGYSKKWNMVKKLPGGLTRQQASIKVKGLHHLHEHVVAKPTGNHGVMHDWLVGLVLEVRLPAVLEMRSRPFLKLLELFCSWTNLDSGVDTIGCQWAGALEIPLLENAYEKVSNGIVGCKASGLTFLDIWITADKLIKTLGTRLGSEDRKGQVVVLEVETNAGEVNDGLNPSAPEFLGVACFN